MKTYKRKHLACGVFSLQNVISGRAYVAGIGHSEVDFELTEEEIDNLRTLICKGSRSYSAFDRHAQAGFKDLPCLSIFDSLTLSNHGWKYCAAQDYRVDMNYIRKLFRDN